MEMNMALQPIHQQFGSDSVDLPNMVQNEDFHNIVKTFPTKNINDEYKRLFEPNAGLFGKLSVLAARSKITVKEGQLVVKILNPNGTPIALFKGTALGDLTPFRTVDMAATKVMKDDSTRFSVDFRWLNDITIKDAHTLPRITRWTPSPEQDGSDTRLRIRILVSRNSTGQQRKDRVLRILTANGDGPPWTPMEIVIHLLGRHYRLQKNSRGTSLTLAGSTGEGKEHWPYIEPAEMSSHVKEPIAHPLRQLLQKSHRWNWTQECESAFTELKTKLTTAPVLAFPRRASGSIRQSLANRARMILLCNKPRDVGTRTTVVQAVQTRIPSDCEVSTPRQWPELRCGELNLAQEADEEIQMVTHWLRRKTWTAHPLKGQNKDLTANVPTRTNGLDR
ncbi:hypothetical protein D917_00847 [Trichinella nativa]|uniref:Uncharacterized protein n=1 Tax=Trichinella nativa TaxID=6335 RepID=A0A1Y3E3R4_9BILA|nr:hypothetical protein D917_00847 [Trichinella nativa]